MSSTRDHRAPEKVAPAGARRARVRAGLAFALGGLVVLFAVLNLEEVEVSWIVGTWQTPLIVVIWRARCSGQFWAGF